MIHTDTIAAIATGMNTAGIGIIRISGDDSFSVVKRVFKNSHHETLKTIESHRVYYGYIYDEEHLIDEVLLIPMKAPKSYTKEDTVEIDCHGGILVMNRILETILKNGARAAEPGEFTKRAFLNGRIDLSEAEAVIGLIESKNEYAMQNSLKHLTGKFRDCLNSCKDRILYETAYIESALDDPEHYDLTGYPEHLKDQVESLIEELHKLIESHKEGQILTEGIHTVILGKPNVGKSTLLNALLGKERAIVTEIAGTTRDLLKEQVMIGGISLILIDSAGIHDTNDPVESIGVDLTRKMAEEADLILMVIDASVPLDDSDLLVFELIKDKKALILLNKNDLVSVVSPEDIKKYTDQKILKISAKEESGFEAFREYIKQEFTHGKLPYNDELYITDQRQLQLLTESVKNLRTVLQSIDNGMPEDFFTIDLTAAYDNLCRITGDLVEDDVINEIFSRFCMGK